MDKLLMEIENMNHNQMNSNRYSNYFPNNNYNMYHHIFNTNNMRGGIHVPTPLYQSLPTNHFHKPPLLPLPIKSYTLPSTNMKINNIKPRNQNRKKKQQQRREIAKKMDDIEVAKPVITEEVKEEIIDEKESSLEMVDITISPPPASSVPLPSFRLMRPRAAVKNTVSSCKAEASAADDLCNLLRI